jgi:hypothetical protein
MILVAGPDTTNLQGFSLRVTALPTPPGIQNSKVNIFSIVIIIISWLLLTSNCGLIPGGDLSTCRGYAAPNVSIIEANARKLHNI